MLNFVKVNFDRHVDELYKLLKERSFTISNDGNTSFEDHASFVKSHPYRVWCMIEKDNLLIGSFYITYENVVSINITKHRKRCIPDVLHQILDNYKPLKEIKNG